MTMIVFLGLCWALMTLVGTGSATPGILRALMAKRQRLRRNPSTSQQQQQQQQQQQAKDPREALHLALALQQVRQAGLHVCIPLPTATAATGEELSFLLDHLSTKNDDAMLMGADHQFQLLRLCNQHMEPQQQLQKEQHRWLFVEAEDAEESDSTSSSTYFYLTNALMAFVCISVAALAAGLTLGMLALDPLLLLIKERAATNPQERQAAATLRPIVNQHHRLLVTLLLMNAVANEALPLFLEALVSPAYAVLVSVTLVLFCGEIIPSAIFTGPNQLRIACALVPVVKLIMWILYPVAGPLAWLLDYILHDLGDEDHDNEHAAPTSAAYTRGELAALIRIQYEGHLATKAKRKRQRASVLSDGTVTIDFGSHVGGVDFSAPRLPHEVQHQQSIRAVRHQVERASNSLRSILDDGSTNGTPTADASSHDDNYQTRRESLHVDEVTMIEGALKMNTQTAIDVFTPYRKVFCIPSDMPLTERNLVHIYASGYTRIPVHEPGNRTAVCGILMTKQLIVVNSDKNRQVGTLPLRTPRCVGPDTSLVTLVNLFQTGGKGSRGGHLALVCARACAAQLALDAGDSVPESVGLMGVITLEDVLEMLLQEQIYDEQDRVERQHQKLAQKVLNRWKSYAKHKRERHLRGDSSDIDQEKGDIAVPPRILAVVNDALATAMAQGKSDAQAVKEGLAAVKAVSEITALLAFEPTSNMYSGDTM